MTAPKRIVLITTGQPASNPRLVKEADALADAGYAVQALYSYWAAWALEVDQTILQQAGWAGRLCGGSPEDQPWLYYWTRLRRKVAAGLPGCLPALKRSFCRSYDELLSAAIKSKADLFIAHNLGALPVAAHAAARTRALYAFDAEDYHRGEYPAGSAGAHAAQWLEDTYLPGAGYLSASSPLICEAYRRHYPRKTVITVRNTFPRNKNQGLIARPDGVKSLKLFWCSQTVGLNRGLQDAIHAMNGIRDFPVLLTIMGNSSPQTRATLSGLLQNPRHKIRFIPAGTASAIFEQAEAHPIGLALEPAYSLNNDLALSNKIFLYLTAGSALIASNTTAQAAFMREYPGLGSAYPVGDSAALRALLEHYWHAPEMLSAARNQALSLTHNYLNWETEQCWLLSQIQTIL